MSAFLDVKGDPPKKFNKNRMHEPSRLEDGTRGLDEVTEVFYIAVPVKGCRSVKQGGRLPETALPPVDSFKFWVWIKMATE